MGKNNIELHPDIRHSRSFITYKSVMREKKEQTASKVSHERVVVPKWEKKRLADKKKEAQRVRETQSDLIESLQFMDDMEWM